MYTRILVAIDNSTTAQKALDEAIQLSSKLSAGLCIVTALDDAPVTQHGMGLGSYIDVDKVKEEMRSNGNTLLAQALAKAQAAGCMKAEVLLIESVQKRLGDMIIGAATQWGADLIVMGTHGRRGFERFLVGSVAEHMVRTSTTSLLLVREN
jgi:nucleotide-binding universal stress UspA family protein